MADTGMLLSRRVRMMHTLLVAPWLWLHAFLFLLPSGNNTLFSAALSFRRRPLSARESSSFFPPFGASWAPAPVGLHHHCRSGRAGSLKRYDDEELRLLREPGERLQSTALSTFRGSNCRPRACYWAGACRPSRGLAQRGRHRGSQCFIAPYHDALAARSFFDGRTTLWRAYRFFPAFSTRYCALRQGAFQRSTAACARASEKLLDKRLAKDLTGRGRAAGETPCGWCQTPGGKDRLVERVTVPPAPGHQRPVTERGAVDALSLSAGDAASSTPDQSTGVNPCKKRTCAGRRRRAQHGNSDVVNKSSTTRAKRSTSGPKPDRTSNELNAVEKVEAAFADVAEFVRSCTDLRFFDSRPDARDLGAERIRPDGDAFWSDEVRKTDTPPGHTGRSEDEAVSARVAGGRLCQSGRPHTQSGELAGGLPQPVQQAVSKFKNAARGLLGLQTRRQGEEEKQNGSAEANAGADLPGAGGDAAATTGGRNTGKSCVWFDTTKYRLMVDRQELMKELGESSKGSWTLRFLGTGAMQASVTRNTSAILFNRGDGVSWLFDCGGGASAAVIPPMPSSALRSRLSPMLERLASISSVRQDLPDLHSDDGGVLTLGPAKCLNSKMRRLRELALQRKHAAVERLLVQPSYAAALSIAAAAVADRGSGEQVDAADWQAGGGRGMPTSATPQTARKKRVSRIGKIFVTHLHGDHCLGIPSLLSQVAAGAMMQRESAEGDFKVSVRRKRGRESDDTATEQEKNASGPPEGYGPAATMNKAPCGSQPEGRTAGDSFEGIASQHGSTAHSVGGDDMPVVEIFGPEGLRNLLRAIFLGTHVRRCAPYRVHELKGVPCLHHGRRCAHAVLPTLPKVSFEAEGGADLWPAADGSYDVFTDSDIRVLAIPIRHNVPTVGYVVEELGKTRRHLNADALQPIVQRNLDALAGWPALKGQPKAVYQLLSALEPGDSLTFPDGTRVNYDDAFEKEAQHLRKFCICVDTCDASPILPFAKGCDLMVHESTLSEAGLTSDFGLRADEKYDATDDLPPPDEDTCRTRRLAQQSKTEINGSEGVGGNIDKVGSRVPARRRWTALDEEAFTRGHSTAAMAGDFAGRAGARRLVLTHFSQRYKGDASLASVALMKCVEREALGALLKAERLSGQVRFDELHQKQQRDGATSDAKTELKSERDCHYPPRVLAAFDGMTVHIRRRTEPAHEALSANVLPVTVGSDTTSNAGQSKLSENGI